jgi:hypothetical protein
MTTEQTDNDKGARTNGGHSFFKVLAALVLAMIALVGILIAGMAYSDTAQSLSSEPVYEATPEQVNPALEGKLVKMRVTELVAEGAPLVDETFGLSKSNAIALHRFYQQHCRGRVNVNYREVHGVRKSRVLAPQVKAGAYTLKADDAFWEDLGGDYINPDELTLPAAWEGHVISRTKHDITLRTNDTSNLAAPQAVFCYTWIPSPWRGVRHIVGRQKGNVLDITGDDCGLIRGEELYRQWSRKRPPMWNLMTSVQEFWLGMLALLGGITLCLLPGVLLIQKRGWLRATCVAALLGLLLSCMVAAALLLLPYAENNLVARAYTLGPCLLVILLLYFACRKKR